MAQKMVRLTKILSKAETEVKMVNRMVKRIDRVSNDKNIFNRCSKRENEGGMSA